MEKAIEVAEKQNREFHASLNAYENWLDKNGLEHGEALGKRVGDKVVIHVDVAYWKVFVMTISDHGIQETIKF